MESKNTFHLKKKPFVQALQHVNGRKRKELVQEECRRDELPLLRFGIDSGMKAGKPVGREARPEARRVGKPGRGTNQPLPSPIPGQASHVPFCILQFHSPGVEYRFPTPSLPMDFFILLLVLGLLSGMVFTFVKACQVASLEQKVHLLETEVARLKERLAPRSSPQSASTENGKSLPSPMSMPEQPVRTPPPVVTVRDPVPSLPLQNRVQPARNARPVSSLPASFSWEYFIGARLLSWIGGFVLFLGTGFFVKYSIDNDLVSPEWRVALTYLAAAVLLGAGLSRLKRKYPILAGTLTSTGILVLYLATCAGRMFYELPFFTPAIATSLLAATTGAAFILAVRLRFRVIAFLGIIGGFLTPVILSTGQDHTVSLFLYMTILNAGLLAVVAATRWTGAGGAGLAAYTILLMGWFDEYGGPSHIAAVAVLALCTLLLYGGYGLYAGTRHAGSERKGSPFLLAFSAIAVTCLTAFRLESECSFRLLSTSCQTLLLLTGMLPMIALLPLARARSTYWGYFLPMGIFTVFFFYQSSAAGTVPSSLWLSSLLQGLFCLFMIPASYAVLSARTPSGGACLAELQPGIRISCFITAALAWLLVIHPSSSTSAYVFLAVAMFCGMSIRYRRGQALMVASAGYMVAAYYYQIHPAGSAAVFLAIFLLPLLLTQRFRNGLLAWSSSALASPLFYLSWWLFGTAHHPEATHFWDSTVALTCAAPPLLAALYLQRLPAETLLKRSAILSFYYGAAIGMLTLAIGLQWTGAPLTVAWSLEGLALLLLCGKFPLPKLAWTGFFLLAFLFVRNGLSQAFVQLDPSGMPALRAMFATMVFCCMAGAWWVQRKVTPRLPENHRPRLRIMVTILNIFGAILLFIWMNTEISCGFAAPGDRPLMIQFGSSVAQDLTISIAWSLFALGLIATGLDIRSSRVRMAGLALLGITLLKVVCYDISSLGQLYRVGALVGLAAIVLISSFLYQKFNMKLRNKKKPRGEAPKS